MFKRPKGTVVDECSLEWADDWHIYQHNVSWGKVLLERNADQEEWETFRGLLCNSAIVNSKKEPWKKKHCPYTPNSQYWTVHVSGSTAVHCPVSETFLPGQWGTGSQRPLVNVTWSPGRQQQWLFWSVLQHTGERKEVIGKQQWESHKNKTGKQKYHECSLKQTLSERFTLTQADWSLCSKTLADSTSWQLFLLNLSIYHTCTLFTASLTHLLSSHKNIQTENVIPFYFPWVAFPLRAIKSSNFVLGPTQAIPNLVVMHPTIQNKNLAWEDDHFVTVKGFKVSTRPSR